MYASIKFVKSEYYHEEYVYAVGKNIHWIHHSLMPRGSLDGKDIVNKVVITYKEQDTISTSAVSRSTWYDIRPEN